MVDPFIIGGLLGALGGGGTQVTQTQNLNSTIGSAFNPVINFGGDTAFEPAQPVQSTFTPVTTNSQTQEQADPSSALGALSGLGGTGAVGTAASVASAALGAVASGNGATLPSFTDSAATATQAGLPITLIGGVSVLAVGALLLFTSGDD